MPTETPAAAVLVIDDEQDVVDLIAFNMERAGFRVLKAFDGNDGLETATKELPDLIILDLMLPGRNGFQVFEALKQDTRTRDIPVLMLTAKAETTDRIQGLKMGADDYVTKPFSPKELVLRVQALLRWSKEIPVGAQLRSGPFLFDTAHVRCYLEGELLNLTATEFKLLGLLLENEGHTVSREEFLQKVWGIEEDTSTRTLDTHIMRLREKLGRHADCLRNVRATGYCYQPPA